MPASAAFPAPRTRQTSPYPRARPHEVELHPPPPRSFNWRDQVVRHPAALTAATFAGGLALGMLVGAAFASLHWRRRLRRGVRTAFASGRALPRARGSLETVLETLIALGPEGVRALSRGLLPALRHYARTLRGD